MREAGNNLPQLQTAGYRCSVESLGETFSNSKVTAAGNSCVTSSTKPEAFHPCCTLRPWIFRARKNVGFPVHPSAGFRKKHLRRTRGRGLMRTLQAAENALNEGHGFSRATSCMRLERALAPEVLLFNVH